MEPNLTQEYLQSLSIPEETARAVVKCHQAVVQELTRQAGAAELLRQEYAAYRKEVTEQMETQKKQSLVRRALLKAGANDCAVDLMVKEVNLQDVALQDDTLVDEAALLAPLRQAYAGLFGRVENRGTGTLAPPVSAQKDASAMSYGEYKAWRRAIGANQ